MFICIVPSPPVINSVSDNITGVVRVYWNRPTELNGVLTYYTINYVIDDVIMKITVDYNGEQVRMYIKRHSNNHLLQ